MYSKPQLWTYLLQLLIAVANWKHQDLFDFWTWLFDESFLFSFLTASETPFLTIGQHSLPRMLTYASVFPFFLEAWLHIQQIQWLNWYSSLGVARQNMVQNKTSRSWSPHSCLASVSDWAIFPRLHQQVVTVTNKPWATGTYSWT